MFYEVIRQFAKTLTNLDAILEKATRFAESRSFDVNNFCMARIAPDMLPFSKQIQIACDGAKATAEGVTGKPAPKFDDSEKTVTELRQRIRAVIAYLESFTPADFEKTRPETFVTLPYPPGKKIRAQDAVFMRQIPNFFFHVTIVYALLRAGGVEIGKNDYLGALPMVDA
jgi:hypothetical protein